jgi:RimJ/RimL family protein N-acetyltransferase
MTVHQHHDPAADWRVLPALSLTNDRVELRRVRIGDRDQFSEIVYDPDIWRYFVSRIQTPADLDDFLEAAVRDTLTGVRIVFAIIDRVTDRIVGSSAFGNLAPADRRLEIGWSWVAPAARRTGVNRAAKLALLDHAFDVLHCERVEFKTDVLNEGARAGLLGIGAQEEGVLRSYNFMPGGRRRDVIYYSILRADWPTLRSERFAALAGDRVTG